MRGVVDAGFELFDHTADVGIRAWAATMPELVRPAGAGLYAAIGELAPGDAANSVAWAWTGDDAAVLLRDYLAELLTLFERDQLIVTHPDVVEFTPERLVVRAKTHRIDEDRSALDREVKAVTYHDLSVRPIDGGYEATLIVDI